MSTVPLNLFYQLWKVNIDIFTTYNSLQTKFSTIIRVIDINEKKSDSIVSRALQFLQENNTCSPFNSKYLLIYFYCPVVCVELQFMPDP